MNSIELTSHAKVNLRLDILGKRSDGYHEIRTVFQKISLADELSITIAKSGIEIACDHPQVPVDETNLAYRAAHILLTKYKIGDGVSISIKKRIPLAAGLGGGSSNAAATLMGINQLFALGLHPQELMSIGKDNKLEPLEVIPPLWFLLITPDFPISTAWAYGNVRRGLTNRNNNITIPQCINHLQDVITILSNDLEHVVIPRYPLIQEIKDALLAEGAKGSLMSGSGSTVFGIFESEAGAQAAYDRLKSHTDWQLQLSKKV
ncbi:MAG: 4-(cytidine 5'-diphospho)-2-C-methyl-D-erythritol kinase [Planctomycetota bacterium]|jgi:4-diphosphocytidyl-2-C-methyl-D-erythritol kinase